MSQHLDLCGKSGNVVLASPIPVGCVLGLQEVVELV